MQKRYDPLDDWSTSNPADRPPSIPSSLTPDQLWKDVVEQRIDRYSPPTPESPISADSESVDSTWPVYAPPDPGSPTGLHAGPTGGSSLPLMPHPVPSEDRFPSWPDWSLTRSADKLPSTGLRLALPGSVTGGPSLPRPGRKEDHSLPTNLADWSDNSGSLRPGTLA